MRYACIYVQPRLFLVNNAHCPMHWSLVILYHTQWVLSFRQKLLFPLPIVDERSNCLAAVDPRYVHLAISRALSLSLTYTRHHTMQKCCQSKSTIAIVFYRPMSHHTYTIIAPAEAVFTSAPPRSLAHRRSRGGRGVSTLSVQSCISFLNTDFRYCTG